MASEQPIRPESVAWFTWGSGKTQQYVSLLSLREFIDSAKLTITTDYAQVLDEAFEKARREAETEALPVGVHALTVEQVAELVRELGPCEQVAGPEVPEGFLAGWEAARLYFSECLTNALDAARDEEDGDG